MGIELLKDVYDPISQNNNVIAKEDKPESLQSWKDSAPVVRLSAYLKENADQGIRLILSDGKPTLHFEPGLTKIKNEKDKHRWQVATNCLDLLVDALTDLKYLISNGKLTLPDLTK